MAALTTNELSYTTGAAPTYVAAAVADNCEAPSREGQMFLHYKNTTATPRTITVVVPGTTVYGQPTPEPQYTLAATTGDLMIPLHPVYANSSGRVEVTVNSVAAGVSVAAVRL